MSSIDEFTHVKTLVRELHVPKNVRRPSLMEETSTSAGNLLNCHPVDFHTYVNELPQREQRFTQNSFSIPSLVVTGIDNTDHPFGRRFSNFNLGLRRFSASFMVFFVTFFLFVLIGWFFVRSSFFTMNRTF